MKRNVRVEPFEVTTAQDGPLRPTPQLTVPSVSPSSATSSRRGPDDVIFFRRLLLQGRETSIPLAQVSRDARYEDEQQSRVEHE